MKPLQGCAAISCGLFIAALSGFAAAAEPAASLPAAMNLILKENRPLPAIEMLRVGVEEEVIPATAAAQFFAVSGDSIATAQMNDRNAEPFVSDEPAIDLSRAKAVSALDEIVRASAGKRVVMLNEDHYHQQHRAFGLQVLTELRKAGFTHFGAETFGATMKESMSDGAPDLRTGTYTTDPLYADMARQAAAQGYALFDYEERPDQRSDEGAPEDQRLVRERAQAGNIATVLKADPSARVFIYAGSGHIAESVPAGDRKWMAQILKESYGVDPLTINQVRGTPRSQPRLDGPLYRAVSAKFSLVRSTAVSTPSGLLTEPGFDMIIFHPREQLVHGRADWMEIDGYRRPCRVEIRASKQASMVRAFVATEDSRSIPMDQLRVPPGETEAMLALPAGNFRLVREDLTDNEVLGHGIIRKSGRAAKRNNLCLPLPKAP